MAAQKLSWTVNLAQEMPVPDNKARWYADCLHFYRFGAVNATAGILHLARGVEQFKIDINRDPGARLVLAHMAYLLGLTGTGSVNPRDDRDETEYTQSIEDHVVKLAGHYANA